jgi:hypothetical protein
MDTQPITPAMLTKCPHCANYHAGRCPEVRAIEYHQDGSIKRVEYLTPADSMAPVLPAQWQPWQPTMPITGPSGSNGRSTDHS